MPPRKGSKQARGVARRDAIIEAARAELARAGYRGASMRTIARQAGISEAGVLHHFGSRRNLLLAVLADHEVLDRAALDDLLERGGIDALRRLAESSVAGPDEPRGPGELHAKLIGESLSPEGAAHEYLVRRYRGLRALVAGCVRRGIEEGELAEVDPETVAAQMIALADGIRLQSLLDPDAAELGAAVRDYLDGLVRRRPPG